MFAEVEVGFGKAEPVEGDVCGVPLFFEMMDAAVMGTAAKAIGMAAQGDGVVDHMVMQYIGCILFLPLGMSGKPAVFVKAFISQAKGCSNGFVLLTEDVNFCHSPIAIIRLQ